MDKETKKRMHCTRESVQRIRFLFLLEVEISRPT